MDVMIAHSHWPLESKRLIKKNIDPTEVGAISPTRRKGENLTQGQFDEYSYNEYANDEYTYDEYTYNEQSL